MEPEDAGAGDEPGDADLEDVVVQGWRAGRQPELADVEEKVAQGSLDNNVAEDQHAEAETDALELMDPVDA